MAADTPDVTMLGFEKDAGLGDVFVKFKLFKDYKALLPDYLLGPLRKKHPEVVLESIELLQEPKCKLAGLQGKGKIVVQTLEVPLDLCVIIRVSEGRFALDMRVVIKGTGLDSKRGVNTRTVVKARRALP